MANEVLIAHTGQRFRVDFAQFASLDDFKSAVSRQASIPPDCIIALTPDGKPLRLAAFQTEKEIYVYDARTAQKNEAGAAAIAHLEISLPKRPNVSSPPNSLRDQRSLSAWQELFEARQKWAAALEEDCAAKSAAAQERYAEMDAMMRCLDAAVANLEAVVKGVEAKYTDVKKWVDSAQADYSDLVAHWEQYLHLARSIAISPAMLQFMTGVGSGRQARAPQHATLEDLVDGETARKAGKLAAGALRRFNTKAAELERTAPRLLQGCEAVLGGFERTVDRSVLSHAGESVQLLHDIRAVASKIGTDYQTILDYAADAPRDVLQASKIAVTHTERLLPSIRTRAREMDDMHRYATQARNALARESVDFMRTITELTSLSSDVKAQMAAVSGGGGSGGASDEEDLAHFDYLRLVQQIPFVYASFVGEAVRRREWLDKVKADSSTLANEMALFHDEEVKRRKKWQKSVANLAYGPPASTGAGENQVARLEINLLGEEAEWPAVVRKDLEDFYGALQRQKADPALVADVGKTVAELSAPTKQQAKRIKGFKNGSVHEAVGAAAAVLGRSGLLIRGDGDVLRSLQEDKGRLENKLKTAESRVRRLEDLLHRQSQASRASLGGLFSPSQQLSDRRTSLDGGGSEAVSAAAAAAAAAAAQQRIQQLEADVAVERERAEALGRDLQTRAVEQTDMRTRMDETNSTKKDLLENLEALKREFTSERKALEAEIKRLQARLDDTEDEMEHVGEAREQERAAYDDKVAALEAEQREARDEMLKTQGQVDFLRKETRLQREQNDALQKQLQAAQDKGQAAAKQLQAARAAEAQQAQGFRQLYEQLFSDKGGGADGAKPVAAAAAAAAAAAPAPPTDAADLIEAVSGKLADTLGRAQTAAADLAVGRADLERAEAANAGVRAEAAAARAAVADAEQTARRERERLAEEQARAAAVAAELATCRDELGQLRRRMAEAAEGETAGAEALRRQLEEAEATVQALTAAAAATATHVSSVEEELRLVREQHGAAAAALTALEARFEARMLRTKDLSQRLYTQNDRVCRLLERLGFAVSRAGDATVIARVPRAERSAVLEGGGALSLMRRPGGTTTTMTMMTMTTAETATAAESTAAAPSTEDTAATAPDPDVDLLFWMDDDAETETTKYAAYMAAIGSLDMDAVAETLVRRVKEVEHVARKLQRDVRSYREKAHALQKEAQGKIAFRHFKEGDLALFLPTRNQTNGAWAAFNIGFPHYFLREQEQHRLQKREWLVARITRVQEKVVDLSKAAAAAATTTTTTDNPFDLSDGLRWYLIDAQEDKPGAPSTPGLGKSTVAANHVEAVADMHSHVRGASGSGSLLLAGAGGHGQGHGRGPSHGHNHSTASDGASRTLERSLESRRSSTSSRRASPLAAAAALRNPAAAAAAVAAAVTGSAGGSETNSLRAAAAATSTPAAATTTTTTTTTTTAPPPEAAAVVRLQRAASADSQSAAKRSVVWEALWP